MALTKITLTNIDNTGDYSELVDSAYASANVSDQRAVTSGSYANSAYAAANASINYIAIGTANAAYAAANASINYIAIGTANAAFAAANVSDQRAVTSGSYANSAFVAANSASVYANAAYLHANAAFNVANTNSAVAQSGAEKTSSYTLAITDVGKFISVGSGGSIIIPNSVFAAGDAITIFNNTASGVTITCSITTAYITGFDVDKASVSLTTRGVATILFITSTVCVMAGSVT